MTDGPGFDMRAEYTKYEYLVPMRDGVRLLTSVLVPKDDSQPYPILLFRSPFGVGPYGPDETFPIGRQTEAFLRAGYIFVRQDVRGRLMSEGDFTHVTPHRPDKQPSDVDESTDTWDTVEWLLAHLSNHNGNVGIYGISYVGFFTAAGIIDTHPAIKAASPQAPVADLFLGDDWFHGGALMLAHAFNSAWAYQPQTGPTRPPLVDVPFFEHHLKDGADPGLPGALVFDTGTNVWRRHTVWPPPDAEPQSLYFRAHGGLSFEPPPEADGADTYVSDPAKPVPWVGYPALTMPEEYMVSDQRFAATRPDVLVYETGPLEDDLAIAGPVTSRLFVSTTGTDADWIVKLIYVYPPDRNSPEPASGGDAW